jgi:hypothetical protein
MPARAPRTIVLICEADALPANLRALELLSRLGLIARRLGGELRVRGCSEELRGLIELTGLSQALGIEAECEAGTELGVDTDAEG